MTPIQKKPSIPGTKGKPICHVQPLEEANTNLIAHNNDRLPLRTSSLNEETKTNLIAHNNSGYSFCLMYKTFSIFTCQPGKFPDRSLVSRHISHPRHQH